MRTPGVIMAVLLVAATPSLPRAADPYEVQRQEMVAHDLRGRGIRDRQVLAAMGRVPRHLFVAERYRRSAYADHPLPTGEGQTISQPYMVALMTESLGLTPSDRVLEIGTGSGYQAAVLAELVREVCSIEIRKGLADQAAATLKGLGYANVRVKYGDGYFGWQEYAPFDAIIITAAVNHIPPPLIRQLKPGGKMILPLGGTLFYQTLTMVTKHKNGTIDVEQRDPVMFVPMTGEAQRPR
jgi:protein-L-isoaspartate(D-aspartate) O-methyltransferase